MKLVSYRRGADAAYGIVVDFEATDAPAILPVDGDFAARYPSIRAVLAGDALDGLRRWADGRAPTLRFADIRFLPPLHDAEKVICIGVNYAKRHPVHGDLPPPENISLFGKFAGTVVGHLEPLHMPPPGPADSFDYEGELVLVVGREGRFIRKDAAYEHVAGYTIMNDGSVREWQKHSVPAGKNFFASSACGPWMTTADEIADPRELRLTTRLNGEQVQSAAAGDMIFDIPTLVNYVSTILHLQPGDLISTGSPEGSGASRSPQRFLKEGDMVEVEWSGLGVLRNQVAIP